MVNFPANDAILDQLDCGVLLIKNGIVTAANQPAAVLFARHAEDLIGAPLLDLAAWPDHEAAAAWISWPMEPRATRWEDMPLRSVDGATRYATITINPHPSGSAWIATLIDTTQVRQREKVLATEAHQFHLITDHMMEMVSMGDQDDRFVYLSPSFETVLGYPADALIGAAMFDLIHPDDLPRVMELVSGALARGEQIKHECRCRHREGHYLWVETSVMMVRSAQWPHIVSMAVSRDVTERKTIEIALRESEQRYRFLAEYADDLIAYVTIPELRCTYLSPSYQRLLGYSEEELQNPFAMAGVHRDDQERVSAEMREQLLKQDAGRFEYRMMRRDGTPVWVEAHTKSVRNDEGRIVGLVSVARDITQRNEQQQALVEREKLNVALEKERELSDLKTRMMSRIAHEFRTPLSKIMISGEMVDRYADRITPERRLQALQDIRTQVLHITDMLDDLQFVTEARFRRQTFMPRVFDLARLCNEIYDRHRAMLNEAQRFEWRGAGPLHQVYADEALIRLMLNNVLNNAIKYLGDGAWVDLEVTLSGDTLEMCVSDNGIGISPSDQARLFQPFFRAVNIGEIPGLGIGMSVVKEAVELHGGVIGVESILGEGTTFKITLPIVTMPPT